MLAAEVDAAIVALSHPARRELVRLCVSGERSAGELGVIVRLRQSTTSQHLRMLRDAGLLVVRRDGNRRLYRVDFARLATVQEALDAVWGAHLPDLERQAEAMAGPRAGAEARARPSSTEPDAPRSASER
jgi:DNA-binding transcriptional ArsR family regulator